MPTITDKQRQLLQHMLGADSRYRKKQWGFRNHFCASIGSPDDDILIELNQSDLVSPGIKTETLVFYHATQLGAEAIGFKRYQLKNTRLARATLKT